MSSPRSPLNEKAQALTRLMPAPGAKAGGAYEGEGGTAVDDHDAVPGSPLGGRSGSRIAFLRIVSPLWRLV